MNGMFAQQGWQCPICQRVYSPTTPMCFSCPAHTTTSTMSATSDCQRKLKAEGKAYPRTCGKCGMFGPCQEGRDK